MKEYKEYKALLRQRLTDKRYHHTLCVADRALELAKKYGADPEKAYVAGLLHDICKDLPREKMLQTLDGFGILLSDLEKQCPKTWHAIAGEAYIRRELGITDREILDAVRFHTTGRSNMTLLDKVLYLADFTSADRNFPGVEEIRAAVDLDLEQGLLEAFVFTVKELAEEKSPIHTDTIEGYNQAAARFMR